MLLLAPPSPRLIELLSESSQEQIQKESQPFCKDTASLSMTGEFLD